MLGGLSNAATPRDIGHENHFATNFTNAVVKEPVWECDSCLFWEHMRKNTGFARKSWDNSGLFFGSMGKVWKI